MSDEYTEGPWRLILDMEQHAMSLETERGHEVTGVSLWLDDACDDLNGERIANAQLIAAAPDMKHGLEQAAKYLRGGAPVEMALDAIDHALDDSRSVRCPTPAPGAGEQEEG